MISCPLGLVRGLGAAALLYVPGAQMKCEVNCKEILVPTEGSDMGRTEWGRIFFFCCNRSSIPPLREMTCLTSLSAAKSFALRSSAIR